MSALIPATVLARDQYLIERSYRSDRTFCPVALKILT